jgi:hypothetical protein
MEQGSSSAAAAILLGTAVNQDGRSSSLTAPNGPSQQQVIRAALLDSGLDAAQWQAVEMHGTGTALGDPIEIGAAFAVAAAGMLSLSAAKSRLGHAETAAGAIGITHAVQCLGSAARQPMLHLAAFNPYVSSILAAEGAPRACIPRQVRPFSARIFFNIASRKAMWRLLPLAGCAMQRGGTKHGHQQLCLPGHECPCHPVSDTAFCSPSCW